MPMRINRISAIKANVALTALDENAAPAYDRSVGQTLANLGAWVGAMTPAKLADFMAQIMRQ